MWETLGEAVLAGRRSAVGFALVLAVLVAGATLLLSSDRARSQTSCMGSPATIEGTSGDDVSLIGTPGNDVIDAKGGNDFVNGMGGDDKICLGSGVDVGVGGDGDDVIQGGPDDDLIVGDHLDSGATGTGDDDLSGGAGNDTVVGDVASAVSEAAGEGDDKLSGGDGNDTVVGDAVSTTLAAGTGEDDIDGGPGSDLLVGDAMVGSFDDLIAAVARPQAAGVNGSGNTGALGTGGDTINAQGGDDVAIGDAVSFLNLAAECSKGAARKIVKLTILGLSDEEIADKLSRDEILAEFDDDLLIGDCVSWRGKAKGAAKDRLNGGDGHDISVGDNVAGKRASGSNPGTEKHLGGKGNDQIHGDHLLWESCNASCQKRIPPTAVTIPGFRALNIKLANGRFRFAIISSEIGEAWAQLAYAQEFNNFFEFDAFPVGHPQLRNRDAPTPGEHRGRKKNRRMKGGGKDKVRGGAGKDFLEGGADKDKCSGGPGKDKAVTRGPLKCEKVSSL